MTDTKRTGTALAVVIGAAVGNGISYAVLFVFGFLFLWYLVACGVPAERAYTRAHESFAYLVFAHSVALICLLPGGYWAARLSQTSPMRNSVLAGFIVSALTLLAYLMPYDLPAPNWSRAVAIATPLLAYPIGAFLQKRTNAA